MSSSRARRAAAPTSFALPKVNRGWGVSRARVSDRNSRSSSPYPGVGSRGGGNKRKSPAALAMEARGGRVRKFQRVKR
jgi:hypothetical protein